MCSRCTVLRRVGTRPWRASCSNTAPTRMPGRKAASVPLHAAAQAGNDELYGLLVASGADQDAATDDGRTMADFRADS